MPPSPPLGYGPATVFFHTFNFPDKCGFNTNASLFSRNPLSISTVFGSDISLRRDSRTRFLPTSPVFDAPFRGFPSKYCYNIWCWKTRMVWLPDGENNWWYVYSFRQNTRKWQTDNARRHRPRLCVASRGNKTIRWTHHIFYVILHPRTRRLRAAARATTTMWPRLGCAATFLQRSCLHMLSWDFFNLIYVITKQKADICNSFQVIVRTETSANCIVYARVRDNYTTI